MGFIEYISNIDCWCAEVTGRFGPSLVLFQWWWVQVVKEDGGKGNARREWKGMNERECKKVEPLIFRTILS